MEYRPFGVTLASDIPARHLYLDWKAYRLNKSERARRHRAQKGGEVRVGVLDGVCNGRSLGYLLSREFGVTWASLR